MLAISCNNGAIQLLQRYDDPAPKLIRTGLYPIFIEWANSKELLCVAGARIEPPDNVIQIYTGSGRLVYCIELPYSPVSFYLE